MGPLNASLIKSASPGGGLLLCGKNGGSRCREGGGEMVPSPTFLCDSWSRDGARCQSPGMVYCHEKDARKGWRDVRLALSLREAYECVVIVGRVHSGASCASSHKVSIRNGFE